MEDGTMDGNEDYQVGYKKPPLHTRFQKGQSGNPSGRPRGSTTLAGMLRAALDKTVVVTLNGKTRRRRKRDLICAQLVDRAAAGDMAASRILFVLLQQIERNAPEEVLPIDEEADRQVMQSLYERCVRAAAEASAGCEPGASSDYTEDRRCAG
jgi:hypothetical protein